MSCLLSEKWIFGKEGRTGGGRGSRVHAHEPRTEPVRRFVRSVRGRCRIEIMIGLGNAVIAVLLFGALVPVLVLPWSHRQYARYGTLRGWPAVVAAAEVLYLCGLVAFTLFPLPDETAAFCAARTTADFLTLNPLNDLAGSNAQLILNVVLFAPLGFLLRYRFRRRLLAATAIGFAVSLLVETVQGTAVLGLFACP